MPTWIVNLSVWWVTGIMGIILYWLPLLTCVLVYMVKGFKLYVAQVQARKSDRFFNESEFTLGHILGAIFLCVCPVVNLIVFFRETAWDLIKWVGHKFEVFFTCPVVRDSDKWKEKRGKKPYGDTRTNS